MPSALWKEIKDTQVVRSRGVGAANPQAVYFTHADEPVDRGRGRGRGGRGGRGGRFGRGGRGGGGHGKGYSSPAATPSEPYDPKVADITCLTRGKKGHRSYTCSNAKLVHFASSVEKTQISLSTIETFHPAQDQYSGKVIPDNKEITSVLLSTANDLHNTIVMLDTQSSIHLVSNSALLTDITDSTSLVTVQGITGDKVGVTLEIYIKDIGVAACFGPHMAANTLSYHKLQETHNIYYDEHEDTLLWTSSKIWMRQRSLHLGLSRYHPSLLLSR